MFYSITADHKVLNEGRAYRHNHRYSIVVQDLATQWIQSYSCKTKTSQETGVYESCSSRHNSLDFRKSCEDLSWNHRTTNGIAERAVRRIKEGTSAVLLQSGLDEKWRSMQCYFYVYEMFKTSWKMGKHLVRGDSENHLKGPIIEFGSNGLNIFRSLQKISEGSTNLVRGSCQAYSSDMHWLRGGTWKGDIFGCRH